ncbi:hypothetical protein M1D51_19620 [Arthrobacter sp. R3-55]
MFTDYVSAYTRVGGRDLRGTVLQLLKRALTEGLMAIGSLDDIRHEPWPAPPTEALERVPAQWPEPASLECSTLEAIAWLSNTAQGDQAGGKWAGNGDINEKQQLASQTHTGSQDPPGDARHARNTRKRRSE